MVGGRGDNIRRDPGRRCRCTEDGTTAAQRRIESPRPTRKAVNALKPKCSLPHHTACCPLPKCPYEAALPYLKLETDIAKHRLGAKIVVYACL